MNATDVGRELGNARMMSFMLRPGKSLFNEMGQKEAEKHYKQVRKRTEFLEGWMSNYKDIPAISSFDEEIQTY